MFLVCSENTFLSTKKLLFYVQKQKDVFKKVIQDMPFLLIVLLVILFFFPFKNIQGLSLICQNLFMTIRNFKIRIADILYLTFTIYSFWHQNNYLDLYSAKWMRHCQKKINQWTLKENNAKKVILSEYIVYIFYLLLLLHLICNITPAMQIVFTKKKSSVNLTLKWNVKNTYISY